MNLRPVLIVLIACALATFGFARMTTEAAPHRVEVTAKRFAYEPAEVTLKVGVPAILAITSIDVPHGIRFKELNLDTRVSKGKTSELAFTPTSVGNYVGHCSVFCGSGHGSMTLTLHVVP